MKVFILGYPKPNGVGGATGEAMHAAMLWRRYGLDVTWVVTHGRPDPATVAMLDGYGMQTVTCGDQQLRNLDGLRDNWAVWFCSDHAPRQAPLIRRGGGRCCFVPCMCYYLPGILKARTSGMFDAMVCQSEFQRKSLKAPDAELIRGAFAWWLPEFEFSPRPHLPDEPFVVGKLGRQSSQQKWSQQYWRMCDQIPNCRPITMGFNDWVLSKAQPRTEHATTLPEGAMPAREFYSGLHCYLNHQDCVENWPRVGLEAMAYGVPLVVEDRGGWAEMVTHNVNGMVYNPQDPLSGGKLAAAMAVDEEWRMELAASARRHLETVLAEPEAIWSGWRKAFGLPEQKPSEPKPNADTYIEQHGYEDRG